MKYVIQSGSWYDLDHTKGEVIVDRHEDDGRLIDTIPFGLDIEDKGEMALALFEQIEDQNVQLEENKYEQALAGLIPLDEGYVIVENPRRIEHIEELRKKYRNSIRNRIEGLNSGYNQAKGRRSEIFKRNIERKIDNLLAAEDREDFLTVDLQEVEDA